MDPEMDIEDEEVNDSEKNNDVAKKDDATKKDTPPADDTADTTNKKVVKNYRPSVGEKVDVNGEMVPLKKFLDLKKVYKDLKSKTSSPELNNKTLEAFAEETGLTIETAKKFAEIVTKQAKAEALKAADERVAPILIEKMSKSNLEAFEQDFEQSIATKYPDLANKKETFKKIAFSKDFLHLKSLDEIRQEFYPDVKPSEKQIKKETIEGGSKGGNKETETIDFSTLKENPELYERVMKDPVLKKKYYAYQDAQSL